MRKGLIITGPQDAGKGVLAKWISAATRQEQVMVCGLDSDLLHSINRQMSDSYHGAVLIIEDLCDADRIDQLFNIITDGLEVHPKAKPSFFIPAASITLIVIIPRELADTKALHRESVLRRFDVVNVSACGWNMVDVPSTVESPASTNQVHAWANAYFSADSGNIGKAIPFVEVKMDFEFSFPDSKLSTLGFRLRLEEWCRANGLIYIPATKRARHLLMRWPIGEYDRRINTWFYDKSKYKVTSMVLVIARK